MAPLVINKFKPATPVIEVGTNIAHSNSTPPIPLAPPAGAGFNPSTIQGGAREDNKMGSPQEVFVVHSMDYQYKNNSNWQIHEMKNKAVSET